MCRSEWLHKEQRAVISWCMHYRLVRSDESSTSDNLGCMSKN